MNDKAYKVQELSPLEREAFLASYERRFLGKALPKDHRKMLLADGFEVVGSFGLTARNTATGEVAWVHEQENLITDVGRRAFFDHGWNSISLGFAPSQETPSVLRPGISTDGTQVFVSGNLGAGTVTPSTYTKTWSTTFGTPGSNRTLGTLFAAHYTGTRIDSNYGFFYSFAYTLLTPPKTQTTTQTIELVYKMAINPIY